MLTEFNYNWTNWAGNHSCLASYYFEPENNQQIAETIKKAHQQKKKIRVVGSGHSFSPIALSNEILISLKKCNQVISKKDNLVTVQGGITLRDLYQFLKDNQLALPNYGVINKQTISGAISTGTHGSGLNFKSISSSINSVKIIKYDGSEMIIDNKSKIKIEDQEYDLLKALGISLGLFGVIAEVTLACVPQYFVKSEEKVVSFQEYLSNQMNWAKTYDYFKGWWFPHTDKVYVYLSKRITIDEYSNANKFEFYSMEQIKRDQKIDNDLKPQFIKSLESPQIIPKLNEEALEYYFTPRVKYGTSMDILVHDETVPMIVSEYALSLEKNIHQEALLSFKNKIEKNHFLHFPVDLRFTAQEDFLLSPSYQEPVFYIGMCVREYNKKEIPTVMQEFLNTMREFNGRPNWGKISDYIKEDLHKNFNGYKIFSSIRKELDPDNTFINEITEKWFN